MDATVPLPELEEAQRALEAFVTSRRALVLGTLRQEGEVELSVAPFVPYAGGLAVFLSELAPHTYHLRQHRRTEVLLLEDETTVRQAFARTRLSLTCQATLLERNEASAQEVLQMMEATFGGIVSLLRSLPDFHLFLLTPLTGRFIVGFGQAFRVEGWRVVERLTRG